MSGTKDQNNADPLTCRQEALALLRHQKTLALAVDVEGAPWVAPVYFVYRAPGLYFFSSPNAKHIQALRDNRQAAGAVYNDGPGWQEIKGLQMSGPVNEVQSAPDILKITARYMAKFPFAGALMTNGAGKIKDLGQKVRLYAFVPGEIHCTDNRLGFGNRIKITLS